MRTDCFVENAFLSTSSVRLRLPPSPVSGKVKLRCFLAYTHIVRLNCSPLFLLMQQAQKKKLGKKKMPIREFRLCGGDQGSAFGIRKLLKKFDQNFQSWVTLTMIN